MASFTKLSLNVFCTICSEQYCTEDDIWSLSCGHVFHGNCLESWHRRNPSCPECRVSNTLKRRIFLNLMSLQHNSEPSSSQESLVKRISLLERKLEENEINFFNAQLALSAADKRVQEQTSELEVKSARIESYDDKMRTLQLDLDDSETNLMGSLGELAKTECALQHKKSDEAKSSNVLAAVKTEPLLN